MPFNVVFNLLESVPLNGLEQIGVTCKVLSYKDTGNKYYLFNLPAPEKTVLGSYTFIEHHFTVNANERGEDELLRQYHYTAFFLGKDGQRYRVHCYYDSRDQLIAFPAVHVEKNKDNYEPVDYKDDPYNFCGFARESIKELKKKLRETQQQKVNALHKEYDDLNAQAEVLSGDFKTNKAAYLKVNGQQIKKLEELQAYSNPDKNERYSGTLVMLKRIKKAVEELNDTPQIPNPVLLDVLIDIDSRDHKEALEKSPDSVVNASKTAVKQKKKNLDREVSSLKKGLIKLKDLPVGKLVTPVLEFFQNFVEIKVCDDASAKNLHDLKAIEVELDGVAKKLLHSIWQSKSADTYSTLAKLKPFYHLIPESLIFLALKLNDSVLLKFLLESKISPLNYRHFTIGEEEQQYSSLIDYFFRRSKVVKVTPQMVDCLSILIEQGLSLLETDSVTGLPFAALILLDSSHPFYGVLERTKQLTCANPSFYEALNRKLRVLIAQPNYSPGLKSKLEALVLANELFLSKGIETRSLLNSNTQLQAGFRECLGGNLVDRIKQDPDVVALVRARDSLQEVVFKKMSPREKARSFAEQKSANDVLLSLLHAKKSLGSTSTFEEGKSETIRQTRLQIRLLKLKEEHLDILAEVTTRPPSSKRHFARNNQVARQEQIIAEMKKIKNDLNPLNGAPAGAAEKLKEFTKSRLFNKPQKGGGALVYEVSISVSGSSVADKAPSKEAEDCTTVASTSKSKSTTFFSAAAPNVGGLSATGLPLANTP